MVDIVTMMRSVLHGLFAILLLAPRVVLAQPTSIQLPGAAPFGSALTQALKTAAAAQLKSSPPRTKNTNPDGSPKYVNRLVFSASPYLQQHAFNPVNWYPWGDEAFAAAKRDNKPVFLSIGYSTCHWCHVMEEESFDNVDIARQLNENFIAIKVDREVRPDLDSVYVEAVTRITGSAGWPLTVFLTPDRKPFYGGTYFPPEDRYGRPGVPHLLQTIDKLWKESPQQALAASAELTQVLQASTAPTESLDLGLAVLQQAKAASAGSFDSTWGGFGPAPKFPQAHGLTFLTRYFHRTGDAESLQMVEATLDHMAAGGIHDQLGGGLHRYSVDREWRVPHFEKMLYDQAINGRAYLEAYQASGQQRHADVARGIFTYVLRDLTAPDGAFFTAEDADSEGEEGLFYLWTRDEILAVAGKETGAVVADFYGVTKERSGPDSLKSLLGGRMPLFVPTPLEEFAKARAVETTKLTTTLAQAREELLSARSKRPRPFRDDKVITAWNGLMISTLAYGAIVLDRQEYAAAAAKAADFILSHRRPDNRLARFFRGGVGDVAGYLDDYAFLLVGLVDLYEATFDARWLQESKQLAAEMLTRFGDKDTQSLRYSSAAHDELVAAPDDLYDGAVPSAQSVAALGLLRLGRLTMNRDFEARARAIMAFASKEVTRAPLAHTQMLIAADFALGPTREIVIAGPRDSAATRALLAVLRGRYLPRSVRLLNPPNDAVIAELAPFLAQQKMRNDQPTVYVCENYVCDLPTNDPAKLDELLKRHQTPAPEDKGGGSTRGGGSLR